MESSRWIYVSRDTIINMKMATHHVSTLGRPSPPRETRRIQTDLRTQAKVLLQIYAQESFGSLLERRRRASCSEATRYSWLPVSQLPRHSECFLSQHSAERE